MRPGEKLHGITGRGKVEREMDFRHLASMWAMDSALEKWLGLASLEDIKQEGAVWCAGILVLVLGLWLVKCTQILVVAIKEGQP